MSAQDNGGAAFPTAMREWRGPQDSGAVTLRDYFASKAMAALIQTNQNNWPDETSDSVSEAAYEMADAMLEARK